MENHFFDLIRTLPKASNSWPVASGCLLTFVTRDNNHVKPVVKLILDFLRKVNNQFCWLNKIRAITGFFLNHIFLFSKFILSNLDFTILMKFWNRKKRESPCCWSEMGPSPLEQWLTLISEVKKPKSEPRYSNPDLSIKMLLLVHLRRHRCPASWKSIKKLHPKVRWAEGLNPAPRL